MEGGRLAPGRKLANVPRAWTASSAFSGLEQMGERERAGERDEGGAVAITARNGPRVEGEGLPAKLTLPTLYVGSSDPFFQ